MPDLFQDPRASEVSLEQKIKAVKRELSYRMHAYPRLVQKGRMLHKNARFEILVMESILDDYKAQASQRQLEALKKKEKTKRYNPRQRSIPIERPVGQIMNQVKVHTECSRCHDTGVDPSSSSIHNLRPCSECNAGQGSANE